MNLLMIVPIRYRKLVRYQPNNEYLIISGCIKISVRSTSSFSYLLLTIVLWVISLDQSIPDYKITDKSMYDSDSWSDADIVSGQYRY